MYSVCYKNQVIFYAKSVIDIYHENFMSAKNL